MATTTNFGWETPDDTDLVKDGAAAMRTLGNSIDTSFVDLKGGTSGQMLTKASNTDLDYTWVTPEIGDITAITVTSPITGGGTTGSVGIAIQDATTSVKGAVQLEDSTSSTSTVKAATPNSVKSAYDLAGAAIPKSLIDAAGDLIVGTAADTAGRLAKGTAGQVLQVNSGATALEWATPSSGGGMTLLHTVAMTGGSTVTQSGISGSYKHLLLVFNNISAGGGDDFNCRFNSDSGSNYRWWDQWLYTSAGNNVSAAGASFGLSIRTPSSNSWDATLDGFMWLYDYTRTSGVAGESQISGKDSSGNYIFNRTQFKYNNSAAISSVSFIAPSTLDQGNVYIYGVN